MQKLLQFIKLSYNSYKAPGFHKLQLGKWFSTAQNQIDLENRRKELMSRKLPKQKPIKGVKHIVLVASGKGGVGKSTTAVNLATALKLAQPENGVGLLDADVFGPSVPLMMNLHEKPLLTKENLMSPLINYGGFNKRPKQYQSLYSMSMGFLIEEDAAVIWRGLMVMQALEKLMRQVDWGNVDYLIVDTPPGTGDTLLSLIQNLPISGVILVTTPQSAALQVTRRGASMLKKLNVPIIGIVENMSSVECHSCSAKIRIFGEGTSHLAKDLGCDILGSFPLSQEICSAADHGVPIVIAADGAVESKCYRDVAVNIVNFLKNKGS